MKNKDYWGDPRYFKLWEKMEMLGIKDISSPCQDKNGTVVWRLPIKNTYSRKGEFIEVASYEAGYVRVLNTCMSPYYINKPIFRHIAGNYSLKDVRDDDFGAIPIKELLKRTGKKPKLIPIEIERLEYLISYCLKNMYIKLANERQTLPTRNESIDIKYWAGYNKDTSGQGNRRFELPEYDFDWCFDYAVEDWNAEADGSENSIKGAQINKVKKLAMQFFKKAGYITVNIAQAMISQEAIGESVDEMDALRKYTLCLQNKLANSVPKWKYDEAMKLGREQDLALREEVKRYDNAVQPLEAQLSEEKNRINDLENKLAVTEANTELFREVHLSAYNKMIKIKEIIGC
jgi:hypothetical protein